MIVSFYSEQFLPTHVEPKRQLLRVLRTGSNTRLAQTTFRRKNTLAVEDVIADAVPIGFDKVLILVTRLLVFEQ